MAPIPNTSGTPAGPRDPDLLIERYVARDCTADDARDAERWLARDPKDRDVTRWLRERLTAPVTPIHVDLEQARAELGRRLDAVSSGPARVGRGSDIRMPGRAARFASWRTPRAVIAGVGLTVAALALTVGVVRRQASSAPVPAARHYATQAAQRATLDLPDGTRVMLAPRTTLRYATDANGARIVELEGQAYFTVTHDPARPFTVRTGSIQTRVLGTVFDVRWYPADSAVQVAVVTGKVASGRDVGTTAGTRAVTPALLTAGRMGWITSTGATIAPRSSETGVDDATAWTTGQLVFTRATVTSVLADVGRWCGYEFRLADPALGASRISTVLRVGNSTETLRLLEELLDVTAHVQGSVVTLVPQHDRVPATSMAPSRSRSFPSP